MQEKYLSIKTLVQDVCYQQRLNLSREVGDRDGKSRILENLASVYYPLEN
ncbi:MAG: hypothetical protein QNJ51_20120 [Calothrix sp. MO_167.B12]|nr:hypothetical protein [Calothrix sp. MO_167.B12]